MPLLALLIWCEQECPDLHGLQLYNKILTATQLPPHTCTLLVFNLQALLVCRLPSYALPSPPLQAVHLHRYVPLTTAASEAWTTMPHVFAKPFFVLHWPFTLLMHGTSAHC